MNFMPPVKSKRWSIWFGVYGLVLWLLLILYRFAFLGQSMDIIIVLRFALFAFVISGILNGFGWLGARYLWLLSTAGIMLGMILMYAYTSRDLSGWEDLAGFLTFVVFMVGGFAIGLLVEGINLIMKRQRRNP
ncbi:hypothetical protein [Paenibacillus wynnii]|uniref:Permease n=1 Tax=Paenibacillus wynnii TaxID=268407 RepID=A0A098M8U3_9BACL|nr:hypothetical protein [Paenibacillus wynnii]KGE18975.1 hypothetical protein PWYN_06135 [Paenibacillus wynnii]